MIQVIEANFIRGMNPDAAPEHTTQHKPPSHLHNLSHAARQHLQPHALTSQLDTVGGGRDWTNLET